MCSWCPRLASFSHRRTVDTNEGGLTVLGRLCQFVVGGGNCAGATGIGNDRAGPERGVFARTRVLIPAMTAAGLPDGTFEAAIDVGDEIILRFGTDFEDALLAA